mgnify:CR=1 FL=1
MKVQKKGTSGYIKIGKKDATNYNHYSEPLGNCGVSLKGRTLEIISYVCVNVTVRCSNLNIPPISEYQEFLFQKISELHKSGLGYRRISYWLKENGYKTPRGHEFKNTHVFSILKKRRLREERINKPYELTYGEWYIKKV